ncbi:MAG: penicillin-binding protein 1B [Thiotrichales bacterium]
MNSPDPAERQHSRSRHRLSVFFAGLALLTLVAAALGVTYLRELDQQIRTQFEGKRWELPARVYARPLELFIGKSLSVAALEQELTLLNYRKVAEPDRPGEYAVASGRVLLHARGFSFPDETQAAEALVVSIADKVIVELRAPNGAEAPSLFRLEPIHIANIYPKHNEDRVLVQLPDVPPMLIDALLALEDRSFFEHHGIDYRAIFRALWANLRAGRTVQGGSTLTQQLVKNYFLSNERTLRRKINEALMAVLLELHYSKDELLEAYLNEIYLGQDGARAIHGFGLASQFYFQRPLTELNPEQLALLASLAKGATYYAPRRHPQRATARRNLVLDALVQQAKLSADEGAELRARPLGVTESPPSGVTSFPGFLELVRSQLRRDYRDEDLRSEGLRIFTTLDPLIQDRAERAVVEDLARIEKERRMRPETLQGAMVVASVEQGEIKAVVSARDVRYAGFNRITDMRRPIGSLIKPAVYLAALSRPERFHLATLLDDSELIMPQPVGEPWAPRNYEKAFHGWVPMLTALAKSYNVATVRLGLQVGVGNVIETLRALGIDSDLNPFPSLFLGAADVPPIEVLQMYQAIAAGGYRAPLRAILAVVNPRGETLQRYPVQVEQAARSEPSFLLGYGLQEVVRSGTARNLTRLVGGIAVAGKTGTTNDMRDSWFAGYSGEHVGVAWIGRDDNQPTGLSGSTGAMRLWASVFRDIQTTPLQSIQPDGIEWTKADLRSGQTLAASCSDGVQLPFSRESLMFSRPYDCRPSWTDDTITTDSFYGF